MIIANLTPEEVRWTHHGISAVLKPGDKVEFEESRANHILNKYSARGIVKLEWSDDPGYLEQRKMEAMETWREFWIRQVTNFNQFNESLKHENKPYVRPAEHIVAAAKRIGIDLVGPWQIKDSTNVASAEVLALKQQVSELMNMFKTFAPAMVADKSQIRGENGAASDKELLSKVTAEEARSTQPEPNWDRVVASFKYLSKKEMPDYHDSNKHLIPSWPDEVQVEYFEKYNRMFGEVPTMDTEEE